MIILIEKEYRRPIRHLLSKALIIEMDVVKKDLDLSIPSIKVEDLDGSSIEKIMEKNGESGYFVAANVGITKDINKVEAKVQRCLGKKKKKIWRMRMFVARCYHYIVLYL